eukprot:scaffold152646_cov82-Attheya_sp.AAC.1
MSYDMHDVAIKNAIKNTAQTACLLQHWIGIYPALLEYTSLLFNTVYVQRDRMGGPCKRSEVPQLEQALLYMTRRFRVGCVRTKLVLVIIPTIQGVGTTTIYLHHVVVLHYTVFITTNHNSGLKHGVMK